MILAVLLSLVVLGGLVTAVGIGLALRPARQADEPRLLEIVEPHDGVDGNP